MTTWLDVLQQGFGTNAICVKKKHEMACPPNATLQGEGSNRQSFSWVKPRYQKRSDARQQPVSWLNLHLPQARPMGKNRRDRKESQFLG